MKLPQPPQWDKSPGLGGHTLRNSPFHSTGLQMLCPHHAEASSMRLTLACADMKARSAEGNRRARVMRLTGAKPFG
jgi:hypothetical protein